MMEQNENVYVVSYYSKLLNEITICCFNNEESAVRYYNYINETTDSVDITRIDLDYTPIYNNFIINEEK